MLISTLSKLDQKNKNLIVLIILALLNLVDKSKVE